MTAKSPRQKVWRNLVVAAVNVAIERKLVAKTGPVTRSAFAFEILGRPALGYVCEVVSQFEIWLP